MHKIDTFKTMAVDHVSLSLSVFLLEFQDVSRDLYQPSEYSRQQTFRVDGKHDPLQENSDSGFDHLVGRQWKYGTYYVMDQATGHPDRMILVDSISTPSNSPG